MLAAVGEVVGGGWGRPSHAPHISVEIFTSPDSRSLKYDEFTILNNWLYKLIQP